MFLKDLKNTLFTNPIVTKEVLLKFRYRRFFLVVSVYAFVTFLITLSMLNLFGDFAYRGYNITRLSKLARNSFIFLTYWQFALITIITISFTAACLTSEKEQNTLSLLYSSQLDSRMIIAGKFITSIMYNIVTILISLPIVSIIFILGGISLGEIIYASFLIFLGTSFFSAVSVFWSAVFKKTVLSNMMSYFTGISFVFGPLFVPLIFFEIMRLRRSAIPNYEEILFILQQINPVFPIVLLFEKGSLLRGTIFKKYDYMFFMVSSCTIILLLALILLVMATKILRKKYIKS